MASSSYEFVRCTLASLSKLNITDTADLLRVSDDLTNSFRDALQHAQDTMLPSYTYSLPSGTETGTTAALDLGGSTLRVAVVSLLRRDIGNTGAGTHEDDFFSVKCRQSWVVDDTVKKLPSRNFFDWIAQRVAQVLDQSGHGDGGGMSIGVTWSFPVASTSSATGRVQKMGKGYEQWKSIAGTDLKSHFEAAFRRKNLQLDMSALMNDTEATLLSHAHANPDTRISLIWGTGINAAVHLPISAVSATKLGVRPIWWLRRADSVLVNTEVSMFGAGIFPLSEADIELDQSSAQPGFQPLEQLTSGKYLGEVYRLILVKGVRDRAIFQGRTPEGLEIPFSLDTGIMSQIEEGDESTAAKVLESTFVFLQKPTSQDIRAIQTIARAISLRAAIYIAITLFSLYRIQQDPSGSATFAQGASALDKKTIAVAYCGAVAEKHKTAKKHCQLALDSLMLASSKNAEHPRLLLEAADDSGLLGASVGAIVNNNSRFVAKSNL